MTAAAALAQTLAEGTPAILVTIAQAHGSTPREAGAAMLVTAATASGTIGGGALELEAVIEARRMLGEGVVTARLSIALGPAIGQCCGGRVVLELVRADAALLARLRDRDVAERARSPAVVVFGAGHTGQAVASALQPLPLRLLMVDTRPERLAALAPGVERCATAVPETAVDDAAPGTSFVVMTHDHALDFLLAARALERGDARYVGMIGSATKREKFARFLRDTGSSADPARLVLPIGGAALRDKRPPVIAALVAAELLLTLKPLEKACTDFARVPAQCNMAPLGLVAPADAESHDATSRA